MPCTSSSLGFTIRRMPLKPPLSMLRTTAPPGLWTLLEPPITTMLAGSSNSLLIIVFQLRIVTSLGCRRGMASPAIASYAFQYLVGMILGLYLLRADDALHYAFFVDDEGGAQSAHVFAPIHALLTPYAKGFHQFLVGVGY